MFKFASTPLSIFSTIQASFQLYRQSFPKVWYWALLAFFVSDLGLLQQYLNLNPSSGRDIFFLIVLIFSFLLSTYLHCFLIHRIYNLGLSSLSSEKESFKVAWQRWLIVLLTLIIVTLIWLPSLLVSLFVFAQIGKVSGIISLLFPALFGIVLMVLLVFSLPLILIDYASAWSSIKRSASLAWGHWWKTAVILAVVYIPVMLAMFLVQFLSVTKAPLLVSALLIAMISTITTPLIESFILVQFNNLKLAYKSNP